MEQKKKSNKTNLEDTPFCSDYLFRFSFFCWTLDLFVSRFEFRPRIYSVSLFILFTESLSRFVFNCYPC